MAVWLCTLLFPFPIALLVVKILLMAADPSLRAAYEVFPSTIFLFRLLYVLLV